MLVRSPRLFELDDNVPPKGKPLRQRRQHDTRLQELGSQRNGIWTGCRHDSLGSCYHAGQSHTCHSQSRARYWHSSLRRVHSLELHGTAGLSFEVGNSLSRRIVEGTADRVAVLEGGTCLDVGCGSGALTIAVAKRNPQAKVVGVDPWGAEYASFSQKLCESNARAEGVDNTSFQPGDARLLPFADESFDAVTSNYVYHNINGSNKQDLLRETLRVLRKGGTFAIHDLMDPTRYGDMQAFVGSLRTEGYEHVELIPTDDGLFMDKTEATLMMLTGSTLLVGVK